VKRATLAPVIRGVVTVGALCACALAAALGAAARTTAGGWTKLPDGPPINFYEASLARTPDGTLHVVYARNGGSTQDVWHVPVLVSGKIGPATPVAQGWAGVENPAVLVAADGTLRAFWGGIKSIDPSNTNDALNTASAPATGAAWALQPGRVSADSNAYVSPVGAARTKEGQFVEATTSTFGLTYHYGLTTGTPTTKVPGNCCYYDPGIGVDAVTGETVLGWYSNEDPTQPGAAAGEGVFLQEIAPGGLVGKRALAPGSAAADGKSAVAPGYRTPVTGRLGAPGVFLAYGQGYPTFAKLALLRFGSAKPAIVIGAPRAQGVNLAPAPQGRLWIFWKRDTGIFATRTNRAATRIEPISAITPPPNTDTVWRLDGEGSLGPLDLVVNAQTADAAFWHRRVLPRLSLHASALGGGLERFVVTDAGDPLAGAKVTLRGKSATTDASGVVTLDVPKGRATAKVAKRGYVGASAAVRVR
jgi:hypothetical protein